VPPDPVCECVHLPLLVFHATDPAKKSMEIAVKGNIVQAIVEISEACEL